MRMFDIISKKKYNESLSKEEIDYVINEYTNGTIPDYQMSALLMAIYFNGMNYEETTNLTLAMAHSGDMMDLSEIGGINVDKHSTGGVGDKTTLILAPMVAACGGKVAKMSGRGLGNTGGTIDKLESIKGFRTKLSEEEFIDNISGEKYDYTKTGKPERPYMLSYHTSMLMKMFLAQPDPQGGTIKKLDYNDVLENVKKIDNLTRGITKVVYLVGWQFNGHDDKYPAFNVFNEALKRPEDKTARDSYLWLKKEAAKYNTIISVHINLTDAYTNSPLWHTYVKKDLLCRNADGTFLQWGSYNNMPNFQVCLINEWKKGYTKKRIDEVIELLDLTSSKTVHIDAFEPRESPFHGYSKEMTTEGMRKIFRYWREKGIDVTSEFYKGYQRTDAFYGLQPAAWYSDLTPEERCTISPALACGGRSGLYGTIWEKAFLFDDNMLGKDIIITNTNP